MINYTYYNFYSREKGVEIGHAFASQPASQLEEEEEEEKRS
ncbi:MAG: hypothetical protein ACLVEL_10965 [Ruthenibacterium sp.]